MECGVPHNGVAANLIIPGQRSAVLVAHFQHVVLHKVILSL
jgi:hypothetical protein